MSEWISVKDRLPGKHGWFLTFGPQRKRSVVHFDDEDKVWADEDDYDIAVTHWMPLPEPPGEDGHE